MLPIPPLCPDCGRYAKLYERSEPWPYPWDCGPVWGCQQCGTWVKCHPETHVAMGTLAGPTLRHLRQRVHAHFDPLWQSGKVFNSRKAAYEWLAAAMDLRDVDCHVGCFDKSQCQRALELVQAVACEI